MVYKFNLEDEVWLMGDHTNELERAKHDRYNERVENGEGVDILFEIGADFDDAS